MTIAHSMNGANISKNDGGDGIDGVVAVVMVVVVMVLLMPMSLLLPAL